MLSRSHGLRLDHNQENPTAGPSHHLPTKTPTRAGKGAASLAPATGGKGPLTTVKGGRVLGVKDRNGGKRDANEPAALLFPNKPSTSQAGPSCQPFKTPADRKTLRPAAEMCTPATGVRPRNAPPLMLSTPSPDVSMEVDEQQPEAEEESDKEVEYAGASARDYDEPFIPDHPEPDYRQAGFGASLRGMPYGLQEDPAEWSERDEIERSNVKVGLDEELKQDAALGTSPSSQPFFPIPPKHRAALQLKTTNATSSISSTPNASTPNASNTASKRLVPPPSSSILRKSLNGATPSSSLRRAPTPSSSRFGAVPSTAKRPTSSTSTSTLRSTAPLRPASSLSSTKPFLASSTLRKTGEPLCPSSVASLSRPRGTPLPPSRPGSAASIRSNGASGSKGSTTSTVEDAQLKQEQQERELGMFGVVADDLDALLDFGEEGALETAFKFDLEL
ncbi:hypothetical protein JCM8547_006239 [Rhodosporidiobolus lusitaniae]